MGKKEKVYITDMKRNDLKIAIIGAGAAGLTCALLLEKRGFEVFVFDKNMKRPSYDHAVGLDVNSLKIYEELGFLEVLESLGRKVTKSRFYNNGKKIAEFSIDEMGIKVPFLLAISLTSLEKKLEAAIQNMNRGMEVLSLENTLEKITVEFSNKEKKEFDLVIACDGANSPVRKMFNIEVDSYTYPFKIEVLIQKREQRVDDCPEMMFESGKTFLLKIPYSNDRAQVVRVIDPKKPPIEMSKIPKGEIEFSAKIPLEKKLSKTFYKNRVLLLGDAAHKMTPFGGRGLNLSIADAKNYASSIDQDLENLNKEAQNRRKIAKKVLRETHFLANNIGRGRIFVVFAIKFLNRYKKFFSKFFLAHLNITK